MRRPLLAAPILALALAQTAEPAASSGEDLHRLVEQYWDELEALNPGVRHVQRQLSYNDRLGNSISPEHVAASLALEKKYLAESKGSTRRDSASRIG